MMPTGKNINDPKLNQNELAFCYEYIANSFNGTKAAIAAGYSEKGANARASELLARRKVQDKIKELTEKYLKKIEFNGQKVLNEIALLSFSDMRKHMNADWSMKTFDEMGEATRAIQSVEIIPQGEGKEDRVKFKLYDKKGSLELLGKNLKLFQEKEVKPQLNLNINAQDLQTKSTTELVKCYNEILRSTVSGE